MNRKYPHGTIVEVVSLPDYNFALKTGNYVIVHRRDRFGMFEATCKQLEFTGSEAWLWPRSSDPLHQQPTRLPWPPQEQDEDAARPDGMEAIWIAAIVVRAHTVEVDFAG